jgi:multidrug efflux system membrane fusion protein
MPKRNGCRSPGPVRRNRFRIGLFLLGCCWGSGCSERTPPSAGKETDAIPVTVALALKTNVPVQLRAIGHATASATVAVRSQVEGMLQNLHFHEGDIVKAGDLMFTIDPRPFEASLKQAKANLDKDIALEKDAEMEQKLNGALLQSKITSQENYAQSAAAADSLKSELVADRAIVEEAELGLSYCFIRSPISGRAGFLQVSPGNVIDGREVLVTLNQTRPIYVDFTLSERELSLVRGCMATEHLDWKVEAHLPGHEQPALSGELAAIDNLVDTNTGSFLVRTLFSNEDEMLWPGQLVNAVVILRALTNAVVVPSEALRTGTQGHFVFVVGPEMTLESRPVDLSEQKDGQAILIKGISPGDQVVAGSESQLSDGMRVRVQPTVSTAASTAPH